MKKLQSDYPISSVSTKPALRFKNKSNSIAVESDIDSAQISQFRDILPKIQTVRNSGLAGMAFHKVKRNSINSTYEKPFGKAAPRSDYS